MFNSILFRTVTGQMHWNISETIEDNLKAELIIKDFGYCIKIYGEGRMASSNSDSNWTSDLVNMSYGWKVQIKEVIVEEGVKSLASGSFVGCSQLSLVSIPKSIEVIGSRTFSYCSKLENINFSGTMGEWNKIAEQSIGWDFESSVKSIICTDGIVNL
ncbi:leucine-rich repeat protein [Bacteroides sp.]|uniref:leucine-rich repeat protein n=1 Tax=Bacteroides sp. TaxID=29523 RepID=UPI002631DFDD|nr:leucine-rich repeat protein [Bacteroides sp.]MDD3040811.1 leucine-rich repeat protein [Bacteroides sp.]